jgi:hypothetical protein
VFLIRFHCRPPGAWDAPAKTSAAKERSARKRSAVMTRQDGFDLVRSLARTLPRVEEGTAYGKPSLKVGGKMFACIASHKSAEPNSLVVLVDFDQRDGLLADDPQTYYLTEHYVDHPCVVARLSRIQPDALRDLLLMGWKFQTARQARPAAGRGRRGAGAGVATSGGR